MWIFENSSTSRDFNRNWRKGQWTVFDVFKFSFVVSLRRHKHGKWNDHVYSLRLLVSSRPHYQAEFYYKHQEFPAMYYGIGAPEKWAPTLESPPLLHEYSFQLRVCLPLIYAVFFHWNTSFTPFILVCNSINWWVNQFFCYLRLSQKNCDLQLYEFREGCFKSGIILFWFLLQVWDLGTGIVLLLLLAAQTVEKGWINGILSKIFCLCHREENQ